MSIDITKKRLDQLKEQLKEIEMQEEIVDLQEKVKQANTRLAARTKKPDTVDSIKNTFGQIIRTGKRIGKELGI